MLALVLSLALAPVPAAPCAPAPAALIQQDDAPGPAAVAKAVSALKQAFAGKDSAKLIDALRMAIDVPHADVLGALDPALSSKQDDVQRAALETLGRMQHPGALKRLLRYAKRERKQLAKLPDLHILVVKSVGRHGSLAGIEFLTSRLFSTGDNKVIKARIVALGNTRERKAVAALFKQLKSTDPRRATGFMRSMRITLARLTGRDEGVSQDRWQAWWRSVPKKWEVSAKPAPMPEDLQRSWDGFWGNRRKYMRKQTRDKRGQDRETDGAAMDA